MRPTLFFCFLFFVAANCSFGQKPTKTEITKSVKSLFEKSGSPKVTVDIKDVLIGNPMKADDLLEVNGILKGTTIRKAKVDFITNIYYTDEVKTLRRVLTGTVYKDQSGQWVILNVATTYKDN